MTRLTLNQLLLAGFTLALVAAFVLTAAFTLVGLEEAVEDLMAARPDQSPGAAVASLVAKRSLQGVVLAMLLVWPVAFFLTRRATYRLRWLVESAERLVRGEHVVSLPTAGPGDIGRLARSVRQMETSARATTENLSSDRNRLAAVLAGMVEGVVAVGRDETVLHINEAAARILRHPAESAVGRKVWEMTRIRAIGEALAQTLQTGEVVTRETRVVEGSGDRVLQLYAAPLQAAAGDAAGAVAVIHDMTEVRRLEDVRRDFVANVSHELKTPVTAIIAMVETLLDDEQADPATRMRFLGRISSQCGRLSSMIRDLLDLSRLESTDVRAEFETVDLRRAIAQAISSLQHEAGQHDVKVNSRSPDEPLLLEGDESSLVRMLANLLQNAIKYSPAGGTVGVRAMRQGERLVVEVVDEGIGIDSRHQSRIFERFYRVDKGRSRELGGTGLGLSIVKHVLLAHGGQISLRSAPGEGSTFQVVLPAAET